MDERFLLDASPWYHDRDSPAHLPTIARAVWARKRLRIGYERWARPRNVSTSADPLGLVLKAGQWYLVAGTSHGVRTYRVTRVSSVIELDEDFMPPRWFDLARAWQAQVRDFDLRRHVATATLRMSKATAKEISYRLEPSVTRASYSSL